MKKSEPKPQIQSLPVGPAEAAVAADTGNSRGRGKRSYNVPAVEKALDIIEHLVHVPGGLTVTKLAAELGRGVHEIYRVIQVLEARGYLYCPAGADRYRLSLKLFELAHQMPSVRQLTESALPSMQSLAPATLQSCHLTVLNGNESLIVLQIDSPLPMRYSVMLGAKFTFEETSSGVVIYAYSSEHVRALVDERLKLGGHPAELIEQVHERATQILANGYELRESMAVSGVTNIAVPVFDYLGQVVAALTIPYLPQKAAIVSIDQAARLTIEAGRVISAELGAGSRLIPSGELVVAKDQESAGRSTLKDNKDGENPTSIDGSGRDRRRIHGETL